MRSVTFYTGSSGLVNNITAHRLPYSRKTGVAGMESATDVIIDMTGEIVTRRGTVDIEAGAFHSPHSVKEGGFFYVAKDRDADSALYMATPSADGTTVTLQGIRSSMTKGAKISYAELDGYILYCNGYEHGKLSPGDISSSVWPVNDWTGTEEEIEIVDTPVFKHIDILSGRVVGSVEDEVFFTEYGLPGIVDMNKSRRRFESKVLMVCSVQTGVYISDEKAVYFLGNANPSEWVAKRVLGYPAIEYSRNQELVDPSFFGLETSQLSCLFGTVNGPVIGMPDGTVVNLIDKKIKTPNVCGVQAGSIMVVDETMIIQSGE